jgi:protein-S-isoprenylcysteine O-methyltransferase Ste14
MKSKDSQKPGGATLPKMNLKTLLKAGKVAFLLLLVVQTLFLDLFPITANDIPVRAAGVILYVIGLATAISGRIQLGRNWANLEDYQVISGQSLVQSGLYQFIRHPIYIGDALLVAGLELALNSWLFIATIPLLYIVFRQAVAEEKILHAAFPGYREYQKKTKMFIPFVI